MTSSKVANEILSNDLSKEENRIECFLVQVKEFLK